MLSSDRKLDVWPPLKSRVADMCSYARLNARVLLRTKHSETVTFGGTSLSDNTAVNSHELHKVCMILVQSLWEKLISDMLLKMKIRVDKDTIETSDLNVCSSLPFKDCVLICQIPLGDHGRLRQAIQSSPRLRSLIVLSGISSCAPVSRSKELMSWQFDDYKYILPSSHQKKTFLSLFGVQSVRIAGRAKTTTGHQGIIRNYEKGV